MYITIPDFFSRRFHDQKEHPDVHLCHHHPDFLSRTASGFKAIGTLFSVTMFGVDYHVAMIVGAIVIVGYNRYGRLYGGIYY